MHTEILSEKQKELLPFIKTFSNQYYLVGGTAIGLYTGHRTSIDFDLFSNKNITRKSIKNKLEKEDIKYTIIHEAYDQFHILINSVKLTFFNFPFNIKHDHWFEKHIKLPSLIDLAAMKAFALGGSAKWKDYVDLYFILKNHYSISETESNAENIFETRFNKKLFRQQLSYFEDIDYSESINYIGSEKPTNDEIKSFLTDIATIKF